MNDDFELTKEQIAALRGLKRALAACRKSNLQLIDIVGTIYALNGSNIYEILTQDSAERARADTQLPDSALNPVVRPGGSWGGSFSDDSLYVVLKKVCND